MIKFIKLKEKHLICIEITFLSSEDNQLLLYLFSNILFLYIKLCANKLSIQNLIVLFLTLISYILIQYFKNKKTSSIMQPSTKTIITVHKPILIPKFTNIGFGNPRYNSMVVCNDDSVLIPCGTSLRRVNLTTN